MAWASVPSPDRVPPPPGERPWALVGATIDRVIVDVSGEAYLDLEKEAIAMMKRD